MDVLSISADGVGIIWDAQTRAIRGGVKECAPAPRGVCGVPHAHVVSALVSVDPDKPLTHVWTLGKEAPAYKCGHTEKLTCVAASHDGRLIAGGGLSGCVCVWAAHTGELLRVWSGHYRAVSALAFSPCDSVCVSAGQEGVLQVWDVPACIDVAALADVSAQPVPFASFADHSLSVSTLRFGPGLGLAARLVSCSADATARVWDVPAKRCILSCTFPSPLQAAQLDALEHRLYAGAADGSVYTVSLHVAIARYDARPGAPSIVQSAGASAAASAMASILSASQADALGTPDAEHAFIGHTASIVDIGLSMDASTLVSASQDRTVRVWDTASFQCLHVFEAHHAEIRAMLLLPKAAMDGVAARARGATHAAADAPHLPAIIAPLRKHPMAMPVEWRGSTTGPVDRDELMALAPHVPSLAMASDDAAAYSRAVAHLLTRAASLTAGMGASADADADAGATRAAQPAAASVPAHAAEVETMDGLRARIAMLEGEAERWKVVNNKLMARLQGAAGPADSVRAGNKRSAAALQ